MDLLKRKIFAVKNDIDFNQIALEVFHYQVRNITCYRDFVNHLSIDIKDITHYTEIPFMPIEFFKQHKIIEKDENPSITFTSSGTTGAITSRHYVKDAQLYVNSYSLGFEMFYGNIKNTCLLALLPSYLEREGSSLIYMVEDLIIKSEHPESCFLLDNHELLYDKLAQLKSKKQKTILIGVTYALLDFIEKHKIDFPELIVMETGGMKGRRKEIIREELHKTLCEGFGVLKIHSEYGMTELLAQAYSLGNGIFQTPPWMKVLIRDIYDPLSHLPTGKSGGINVIDLANLYSCSFIATQDLGKKYEDSSFEVLGRFDNSDIRGCNLMISS